MTIRITADPLSARPFHGFGVQADPIFLHPDASQSGITPADLTLVETRLRVLRPANARLFVDVRWFHPALDGTTYEWNHPNYQNLLHQLRVLESLGSAVNLVLFEPRTPVDQLPRLAEAMMILLRRLLDTEGVGAVRWLTLYNEPDSQFVHDSPLAREIFAKDYDTRKRWDDFVNWSRATHALLQRHGLYPRIRLATPDCVWGHPMRVERLKLAVRDLGDLDVTYSYHHYNPEWPAFYTSPLYAYPGIEAETRLFRELVGPDRELIIWETNAAGQHFNHLSPGVGPHGEDLLGSLANAVDFTAKIFTMLNHGVDGLCLWCLSDGVYLPFVKPHHVMEFGLWRDKPHGWEPRPYYYYFAALTHAFRPGAQLLRVTDTNTLAARHADSLTVAILNPTATERHITAEFPTTRPGTRLVVRPGTFPTTDRLPVTDTTPFPAPSGPLELPMAGQELSIFTFPEWT